MQVFYDCFSASISIYIVNSRKRLKIIKGDIRYRTYGIIFEFLDLLRKLFLISLIAVHTLGNTEIGELLKAPLLISHYKEHRKSEPQISFLAFITMHYISGDDGTLSDDWQDNQLPCHNTKQQHSFSQIFPKTLKTIDIGIACLVEKKVFGGRLRQDDSNDYTSAILQPPRV